MLVARVSVATGISPNELLAAPPEVFRAIIKVLNDQADEIKKRNR
jgi:hypothetical protein